MEYLGRDFGNYEELNAWNKRGHVEEYKRLARVFSNHSSMELNNLMCERAEVLRNRFGMTLSEIEELEIEAITA